MYILAIALAVLQANSDTDINYEITEDFARCAALFDHVADAMEQANRPASAEEYRDAGRGAELVGRFYAQEFAGDSESAEDFYSNFYNLEINAQLAAVERGEMFTETRAQRCFDLQPMQIEFIEMLQSQSYQAKPSPAVPE